MKLASLARGESAKISAIDWDRLAPEDSRRLQSLGLDVGAQITLQYKGVFGGADPMAVKIGRMSVALRRAHAAAMDVEPV